MAYTYLVGWSKLEKFYYGVRYAKDATPGELWKSYFTSSKYIKEFREKHSEPDIIKIRKTFNDPNKAREWETKVLKRINAKDRGDFLNLTDNISISSEAARKGVEAQRNMEFHPNKGRKNPSLSKSNSLKVGELNHMFNIGMKHPHYGKRGKEAPNFGKKQSDYQKEVASRKISCPHCDKKGNIGNMKRWHFDNCKQTIKEGDIT